MKAVVASDGTKDTDVLEERGSLNVKVNLIYLCMYLYTLHIYTTQTQTHRGEVGKEGAATT